MGDENTNPNTGAWDNSKHSWWENLLLKPIGSGDNATTGLQLGISGLGLLNQHNQFNKQFDFAKKQYAQSLANTRANFLNQGANFLNQNSFQMQALNAFNPNAAAQRVEDVRNTINTMNQAAEMVGLGNNAYGAQMNALDKYTNGLAQAAQAQQPAQLAQVNNQQQVRLA